MFINTSSKPHPRPLSSKERGAVRRGEVIIAVLTCMFFFSCNKNPVENKKETQSNPIANAILSYMSQPEFTNPGFVQQVTGTEAELQVYDADAGEVYFSINKLDFKNQETLSRLTEQPDSVQFGYEDRGRVLLGEYTLRGINRYFFKFPKRHFKVDTSRVVTVNHGAIPYTVSVKELSDFANNVTIYGGQLDTNRRNNIYMANHGAFVSKKNEPSLQRLIKQITGSETKKEIIAQMLLDFVTLNIKFSVYEANGGYEILKRPNEILLTGKSDCSGLTILYASLLEQCDIDYLLLYSKGHIAVGVAGDFPKSNGQQMQYEGKTYTAAETTVRGFQIGLTMLQQDYSVKDVLYVQRPGTGAQIVKISN